MDQQNPENRKGCSKPVFLGLVIAALVVIAFLIIGLVNTCSTDHQEHEQQQIEAEQ